MKINYFLDFFKYRKKSFFAGIFIAIASIIMGILYKFLLKDLADYQTQSVFLLPLLGGAFYFLFAFFRKTRIGTIILTVFDFASFLTYVGTIYSYPVREVMSTPNIMDIPYIIPIAVIGVLLLLLSILGNVFIWVKQDKDIKSI